MRVNMSKIITIDTGTQSRDNFLFSLIAVLKKKPIIKAAIDIKIPFIKLSFPRSNDIIDFINRTTAIIITKLNNLLKFIR